MKGLLVATEKKIEKKQLVFQLLLILGYFTARVPFIKEICPGKEQKKV